MLTDDAIIRRVLAGRTDDFRELVRRYQSAVYRLALRVLGRPDDAEDAAQDTFVAVFANLASCRQRDRLWAWIRRITLNRCLSVKRAPAEIADEDIVERYDTAWSHDDPVQADVFRRLDSETTATAVAGLPISYRTAVVLRYQEELTYQEISELLGEPVARIQVRIHRAKKMLAEQLAVMRNAV